MTGSKKSIIVVADTHFGLSKQGESCDPTCFTDFLKWIKNIEEGKEDPLIPSTLTSEFPEMENRFFRSPEEIIFLGDIVELWDAPSKGVDFSTRYIVNLLSDLDCKKTYVVGNHDHELANIARNYPLGESEITIKEEEYSRSKGNEEYLFLHGHQFDKLFEMPSWKLMMPARNVATALGSYSFIFLGLFLFYLASAMFVPLDVGGTVLLMLLGFLWIPSLIFVYGRRIWNQFKSIKYDFKEARSRAPKVIMEKYPNIFDGAVSRKINVVYGHTHAIDFYDGNSRVALLNIPGWIRIHGNDSRYSRFKAKLSPAKATRLANSIEHQLYHAFLYIDDEGSEFFGWNQFDKKPYWIPKWLIQVWREHAGKPDFAKAIEPKFKHDSEKTLLELGWVKQVVSQWLHGISEAWQNTA